MNLPDFFYPSDGITSFGHRWLSNLVADLFQILVMLYIEYVIRHFLLCAGKNKLACSNLTVAMGARWNARDRNWPGRTRLPLGTFSMFYTIFPGCHF